MIYRFRFLRNPSHLLNFIVSSSYLKAPSNLKISRVFFSESHNIENVPNSVSNISVTNIKESLGKHKINYSEGFTNLVAECSSCRKQTLFINKVSGFCICHDCGKSGPWKTNYNVQPLKHDYFFTLKFNENIHLGVTSWKTLSASLIKPGDSLSKLQERILRRCDFSNFPISLLKKLNLRFDESQNELCVPLTNTRYEVGYKRIYAESEITFPPSGAAGFISNQSVSDSAIIVPSLRDLVALSLQNLPFEVICLPYGQQKFPQEILPLFEKYKKIVLWFDNDSASWDNVRVFARKLYEERCYIVSPTGSQASAQKALKEGHNLSKIVSSAQPISHPSIITFSSLRNDVIFDLQNIEKVAGVKWKRFPVLNNILKGHRRGELTILTGPTGCGKTTFMSEYSLDLATQSVATLWGSFEIKNQRLARTMLQQFTMVPLASNIDKFNHWADRFEQLPLYFMTFHGQQSLQLVMEVVEHATYVHDIAHVIIDNVQFMLGLTSSETGFLDRFYRQDALIGAFRNFATKANCHVTLVIHPRKEKEGEMLNSNSIFGGAKASQEADNILIMQTKTLNSLKMKKCLQIAKNRYTGDIGIMQLDFDPSLLSFASKKET